MKLWKTDTEYKVGDRVMVLGKEYECTKDHKSNIFADEFFGKQTAQKTQEKVWKQV
jgi:hypothetical protein